MGSASGGDLSDRIGEGQWVRSMLLLIHATGPRSAPAVAGRFDHTRRREHPVMSNDARVASEPERSSSADVLTGSADHHANLTGLHDSAEIDGGEGRPVGVQGEGDARPLSRLEHDA